MGECKGCGDPNKPTVNEESLECCELVSTNCVVTPSYQSFFKVAAGKTLTYLIDVIAKFVKKNRSDIADINSKLSSKHYIGFLNQVLTNAPTQNVVSSSLGTPTLSRVTSGEYRLTSVGSFPDQFKTIITIGEFDKQWGDHVKAYWIDSDTIGIKSGNSADYIDDDVIKNMPLEIRVYN